MSRVENALMRLYESTAVRDELTDEEAEALLKWAENELTRLDETGADDAAFEARVDTLMDLLKQINRFAGRQGQGFSAQGADEAPGKIAELASDLGHAAGAAQIAEAATGDPASTVAALTALLSNESPQATDATAPESETPAAAEILPHDPISAQTATETTYYSNDPPPNSGSESDYLTLETPGDDVEDWYDDPT